MKTPITDMVRERSGDYLAAVEELEHSHTELLRERKEMESSHNGQPFDIAFYKSDSPLQSKERPLVATSPCSCGCDNRGGWQGFGYIQAIHNGNGFTLCVNDEATWQRIVECLPEQKQ